MKDGATDRYEQAYNAQAAADAHRPVIVACGVTQAPDAERFGPMLGQGQINPAGALAMLTADAAFSARPICATPRRAAWMSTSRLIGRRTGRGPARARPIPRARAW